MGNVFDVVDIVDARIRSGCPCKVCTNARAFFPSPDARPSADAIQAARSAGVTAAQAREYDHNCVCQACSIIKRALAGLKPDAHAEREATFEPHLPVTPPLPFPPPTHRQPWLKWSERDSSVYPGDAWEAFASGHESPTPSIPLSVQLRVGPLLAALVISRGVGVNTYREWSRARYALHDLVDAMVFAEDRALELVRESFGPLLDGAARGDR